MIYLELTSLADKFEANPAGVRAIHSMSYIISYFTDTITAHALSRSTGTLHMGDRSLTVCSGAYFCDSPDLHTTRDRPLPGT